MTRRSGIRAGQTCAATRRASEPSASRSHGKPHTNETPKPTDGEPNQPAPGTRPPAYHESRPNEEKGWTPFSDFAAFAKKFDFGGVANDFRKFFDDAREFVGTPRAGSRERAEPGTPRPGPAARPGSARRASEPPQPGRASTAHSAFRPPPMPQAQPNYRSPPRKAAPPESPG